MQKLGVILKQMEGILPEVGASSDAGKVLLDCMSKIAKFVPSGSVTPAAQKNSIEAQQRQQAQGNQQMQAIAAMRQKMAQGGGGQQPGAAAA
jgi:ArsR family metal-binding transcriptional regulator